jgi:hypothetical protein
MYEPGTILALREPQSTDDQTYAYDRVKVVGQSPVQHATASGSAWAGADATGYIITPLDDFGPTLDKPYGELADLYEVEEYPTDPITQQPITPENNPRNAPSPEQQFARAAKEAGQDAAPRRAPSPSVQHDSKSPEQVLREANPPRKRNKNGA